MDRVQTFVFCRKLKKSTAWYVRWKDPVSGSYKTKTAGRDRSEALLVESRLREALFRGEDPFPKRNYVDKPKLESVVELFYQSPRFLKVCTTNQKNCKQHLQFLIEGFGKKSIDEISTACVLSLYSELKKNELSNRTIHKYHFNYCLFGDFVCELSGCAKNPFRQLQIRKYFQSEAPSRDINFLVGEEIDRLIQVLRRSYPDLIWRFAQFLVHTGLRRSEAYALKWTDIDLNGGFITVRMSKNKRSRMVPLEPLATEAIKGLNTASEYVFARPDGTRFHIDSFIEPVQEAARAAGIRKRIDIHTFRHTYGSNKIRTGWGIRKVSQILGHSDIQLTASYYSHLLDGDLKVRDEFLAQQTHNTVPEAVRIFINTLLKQEIEESDANQNNAISETIANEVLRRLQLTRGSKMNESNDSKDSPITLEDPQFVADMLQIFGAELEKIPASNANSNLSFIPLAYTQKRKPMSGFEPLTYALRKRCSTN